MSSAIEEPHVHMFGSKEAIIVDMVRDSVWDFVERTKKTKTQKAGYRVLINLCYYSLRYNKWVLVEANDYSDGATGAKDIDSFVWLVHDDLCRTGKWEDGTKCNNWQASQVAQDILDSEDRWFRKYSWFWATWLLGGGKARKNGMC